MTAYKVTASNNYFFQTLVVEADNAEDAERKFSSYLEATANDEEYQMAIQEGFEADQSDYEYGFDSEDIEEFSGFSRWNGKPSVTVQMINSGPNG